MPFKDNPGQNEWRVGMFESCCAAPFAFVKHCLCPCCYAYQHREHIIGEGEYYCCGGLCPFCCLKKPCPRVPCLCLEVVCCPFNAIMVNRHLIQYEQGLKNNCCDECLIWTAVLAGCVICILQLIGCDVPDEARNVVDCFIWTVCGCMLTQSSIQMGLTEYSGDNDAAVTDKQVMQ